LEPMKPMQPMQPMELMPNDGEWWPEDLGAPASTGSQNDIRYAFFPAKRRLVIERKDRLEIYDSGEYAIEGVMQSLVHEHALRFSSNGRNFALDVLDEVG
jgi:hypothetical protein